MSQTDREDDFIVTLRDALTPEDRDAVRRIVESTGFFSPAEADIAVELVDEGLEQGEASGYDFVFAEHKGRVFGYACFGPIPCTAGSFDLYWIAVDSTCQGRGLGRTLLLESERRVKARQGRHLYIETSSRTQYTPTREFYEKCSYKQIAVLEDFYEPGDSKVIFLKKL